MYPRRLKSLIVISLIIPLISIIANLMTYYDELERHSQLKQNEHLLQLAHMASDYIPGVKLSLQYMDHFINLPTIYLISRVNIYNMNEMADLTRFLNTIRLVPKVVWIVVENTPDKSKKMKQFLERSGIKYVHLTKYVEYDKFLVKNLSLEQYDEGLDWLRKNHGNLKNQKIVYLARTQTSYETKAFDMMRRTSKVMVWPVGFIKGSLYSRPICINGRVTGWYCPWDCEGQEYPIDESAFSISLDLIVKKGDVRLSDYRSSKNLFYDFLKNYVKMKDLEGSNCEKIYIRNVETRTPIITFRNAVYDKKFLELV